MLPSRRSEPLEACPTALLAQLGASELPFRAPGRLSNRPQSATWSPNWPPSATWRFLARFLVLLQPSESSSRLHESSIFMFLHFCLSRLPFEPLERLLGSTCSLLGASWAQLGASYAPLGPNLAALGLTLELLGANLDSTWLSKLASKRNLASKLGSKCNLALLG